MSLLVLHFMANECLVAREITLYSCLSID